MAKAGPIAAEPARFTFEPTSAVSCAKEGADVAWIAKAWLLKKSGAG